MQQQQKTENTDTSNSQHNTEETLNKSSHLIEREQIEDTPFWVISVDGGHFLVMGDYRLSENLPSKEAVKAYLDNKQWKIIMHMCAIAIDKMLQDKLREWTNQVGLERLFKEEPTQKAPLK